MLREREEFQVEEQHTWRTRNVQRARRGSHLRPLAVSVALQRLGRTVRCESVLQRPHAAGTNVLR